MKWNEKFSPSVTLVWFQVLWLVTVILDSAEHFHLKENSIVLNPYYSKGRPAASACESLFVFFFVFFFLLYHVTCGISVPWPGIKLMPPALEALSLNHWTTNEVQELVEKTEFHALHKTHGIGIFIFNKSPRRFVCIVWGALAFPRPSLIMKIT